MFYLVKVARHPVFTSAFVVAALFPAMLSAAPIAQGSFGVAGAFSVPAGAQLSTTDSIFIGNGGSVLITSPGTFDLAGVGDAGDVVTLRDIPSLSGFTPISSFLTAADGTTVNLLSLNVAFRNQTFLNFYGDVDLLAPGFDATAGVLAGAATTIDNRMLTLALSISARAAAAPSNNENDQGQDDQGEDDQGEEEDTGAETPAAGEEPPADDVVSVPEPWSAAALAFGLTALAITRRRKF